MTLTIQEKFDKAVKYVQGLPKEGSQQPTEDVRLLYYGYYKQATIGDVNTPQPGLFYFVEKAKWSAWTKVKGTSKEDAQKEYVNLLIENLKKTEPKTEELKEVLEELTA